MSEAAATSPAASPTEPSSLAPPESPGTGPQTAAAPKLEGQPDPKLAAKFAALSKEAKANQLAKQALKAEQAKVAEWKADLALKEKDPYAWAEKHGLNYSDWTKRVLEGKKPEGSDKIAELEKRIADAERQRLDKEKQEATKEVDAKISGYVDEIKGFLTSKADQFEVFTNVCGLQNVKPEEVIYNMIFQHWEKTGQKMTFEKAASLAEERMDADLERYLSIPKLQERLQSKLAPKSPAKGEPDSTTTRTLSNDLHGNAPLVADGDFLSDDERLRRAMALL